MTRATALRGIEWRGFVLPSILLAAWTLRANLHPSPLLPTPQQSLRAFQEIVGDGSLWRNLQTSFRRFSLGFSLGGTAGFLVGATLGSSTWLERFLLPNIQAFRQIPLVGWLPLLVLWLGSDDAPHVALIAMGAFFPILLNTFSGFRSVPRNFREVGAVFGLGKIQTIRRIVLPAAMPWIRSGTLLSLSFAWTILVASEVLNESNGGLSDILDKGRERFRLELVNVGICVLGGLGFLLNLGLERLWSIGRLRWLSQDIHNQIARK